MSYDVENRVWSNRMEQDLTVITVRKKEYRIKRSFDDRASFEDIILSYLLEEIEAEKKKGRGSAYES